VSKTIEVPEATWSALCDRNEELLELAERMKAVFDAAVKWRQDKYPQTRSWSADSDSEHDMHLVSAIDTSPMVKP
jgi:hypothetical protein